MRWWRSLRASLAPISSSMRSTWRGGGVFGFFRPIWRFLAFSFWATVRWAAGLQLRLLLQGLPALLFGGVAIAILCFAAFTPSAEIETRYHERADVAVAGKDYKTALVCYERLAGLRSDRPDVIFDMANALQ